METRIYSVFPACGKTWLYEHQEECGLKILDSDSSGFSWVYVKDEYGLPMSRTRNPDFPANYISHIKENIGKYDCIFVSSHALVRDALNAECIDFTIVYPSPDLMCEWVGRCFVRDERGESGCNPGVLYDNWSQWIGECEETARTHKQIVLRAGEHLSDYLSGRVSVLAIDIDWDTDGEDVVLPTEIEIPTGMIDEDEISDYLSDMTGFCHKGFMLVTQAK